MCSTLVCGRSAMLAAMFSGDVPVAQCLDGSYFIDRDGSQFGLLLGFLRDGYCRLPQPVAELETLLEEANYFQVCHRPACGCPIPSANK